jgi:hypothetical protein
MRIHETGGTATKVGSATIVDRDSNSHEIAAKAFPGAPRITLPVTTCDLYHDGDWLGTTAASDDDVDAVRRMGAVMEALVDGRATDAYAMERIDNGWLAAWPGDTGTHRSAFEDGPSRDERKAEAQGLVRALREVFAEWPIDISIRGAKG